MATLNNPLADRILLECTSVIVDGYPTKQVLQALLDVITYLIEYCKTV